MELNGAVIKMIIEIQLGWLLHKSGVFENAYCEKPNLS